MNAIELTHVCKAFPGFAIQDLSLAVPSGTICGLVGENGAGKTTAIRLMLGVLRPDSGRCTLLGVDTDSPQILAAKEDVGVVLDEAYFPETLNAVQVGKILSKTYRRWDKDRYDGYLDRFSLPRDKQFKDFSRGMKMKLAIAAALSHGAKLLLLDEATSALDNESEILVGQSLDKLAKGRTTLTIAHRLTTIKNADRILVLGRDGIEEEGSHDELLAKQGVYYRLWNGLVSGETL